MIGHTHSILIDGKEFWVRSSGVYAFGDAGTLATARRAAHRVLQPPADE